MRAFLATFALMIPTVRTDVPVVPPATRPSPDVSGFGSYIPYAAAGGWNVVIDVVDGPTCFVIGTFRSGTTMRFGIDEEEPAALYVVVADPRWKDIAPDREYDVDMKLDAEPVMRMKARSGRDGTSPSLTMRFADPVHATRFATGKAMILKKGPGDLARVALGTPSEALMEMAECRRDMTVVTEALREEGAGETTMGGGIA